MVYEKKVEPIRGWEIAMAGISLQLFLLIYEILPWITISGNCRKALLTETDIQSTDVLTTVHECIEDNRASLLFAATCLLLGFPIIVSHIYLEYRIENTFFAFLKIDMVGWLYCGSWMVITVIICTIIPSLLIFISYYDWEFNNEYLYIGYSIQFQFIHFCLILWDCLIIPLAIATVIRLFIPIVVLLDWCKSQHYKLNGDFSSFVVSNVFNCKCKTNLMKYLITTFLLTIICAVIFSGFASSLDFEKQGFFSYSGNSQNLQYFVYFGLQFQCIIYYQDACKFNVLYQYLNDIVQPVDTVQM